MELGGRVSFPRGFQASRASGNTLRLAIAPVHYHLSLPCVEQKSTLRRVNYQNIIADTLDSLNKARL